MSEFVRRRRFLAGAGGAVLAALGGCISVSGNESEENTRTFGADDVEELDVSSTDGDVSVSADQRSDVRVDATKHGDSQRALDDVELDATRTGGKLRLNVVRHSDGGLLGSPPTMDLDIAVPASLRVAAVESNTGDVDVTGTAGPLEAETSTGDVTVAGVDDSVSVETSTGDVTVRNVARVAQIETSTGDVEADVAALADGTEIETSTGDVDAALSPSLDARVVVKTSTGDVSVAGLDMRDRRQDDDDLAGTLGEGGQELSIETSTGDVSLSALE
jgi:DUF4097 and DUF4098 domain-containing protein YvlB